MIYALGNVSGGHFNPAVTLAVVLSGREKISPQDAGFYALTQIVAGITAAYVYAAMHHGTTFPLEPGKGYNFSQVAAAEIIATFTLAFVVLSVATVKQPLKDFYGLA